MTHRVVYTGLVAAPTLTGPVYTAYQPRPEYKAW